MHPQLYGIPNCNSVKKARQWLDESAISYEFINFKTTPPSKAQIQTWLEEIGSEKLINRQGTTWRKLSEEEKHLAESEEGIIQLLQAKPSLIKRPLLAYQQHYSVGFSLEHYQTLFQS